MKWISAKDKEPTSPGIIVAILESRIEQSGDPVESAEIIMLKSDWNGDEWRSMDSTMPCYFPIQKDFNLHFNGAIQYWMDWKDFGFPESMIVSKD